MKAFLIALGCVLGCWVYMTITQVKTPPQAEHPEILFEFEPISLFEEQPVIWQQKIIKRNSNLKKKPGIKYHTRLKI